MQGSHRNPFHLPSGLTPPELAPKPLSHMELPPFERLPRGHLATSTPLCPPFLFLVISDFLQKPLRLFLPANPDTGNHTQLEFFAFILDFENLGRDSNLNCSVEPPTRRERSPL